MRRIFFVVFGVMAIIMSLCACNMKESENKNPPDLLFWGYPIDNHTSLSVLLTNSYSIDELVGYFGVIPRNERTIYHPLENDSKLLIDVDAQFPIECIRQMNKVCIYSVYKVKQGGYFYVFWTNPVNLSGNSESSSSLSSPAVYFTAYLSELKEQASFQSLMEGVSTAEDVAKIDSAVEMSFLLSSGIYSFSLLTNEDVLVIQYSNRTSIESRKDLLVESVDVVSRDIAGSASYLASIQHSDLP